jgi:Probable sensor domain DACNV
MREPLYPAARTFAARLEEQFARAAARPGRPRPADTDLPDSSAIEALIDAAFWASLQREEGFAPEISLAFLSPEHAVQPLRFASPLPLGPRALARLAPAVTRPGIHLGVWRERGEPVIWGTTRAVPPSCFVLEVLGPGLLVVKHRVRDSTKFRNVAVFEGDEVKLLDRRTADVSDYPVALRSLLAPEWSGTADEESVDVLLRLAVSMRAHKRGGTLLAVPAGTQAWRESIVRPIEYAVEPPFVALAEVLGGGSAAEAYPDALARVVEAVAGLTAVDGATLINDRYELLAFGVKIARPDGSPQVEQVVLSEPIEGATAKVVAPLQLGGTRHLSAAQFAQDQRDSVAMVASQDGHFTIFAWSPREGMVHAHRVETLLF